MRVIALDVSGSSTGWAYGDGRELLEWGKFISNLRRSRGQRLHEFFEWLAELFTEYQPEVILVEKPFLGRNSNVLANLSKFVAMVEAQAYGSVGLALDPTWFVDPRQVKKLLKVKKSVVKKSTKAKHDDNKQLMVRRINELYGLGLKYGKNKSKKYNDDDIADAIAVWHAWWLLQKD